MSEIATTVVDALLEVSKGVEQFMKSLPRSTLASFHILDPEGATGWGITRNNRYSDCHLVYANNPDGTRDFVGYIRNVTGAEEGDYWVTVVAKGPKRMFDAYTGQRHPTRDEAARTLLDIQQAGSRYADAKKAKLHWRIGRG